MKHLWLVLAALLLTAGAAHARDVGFQALTMPNGSDAPVKIGVWYPRTRRRARSGWGCRRRTSAPDAPVAG